VNTFFIEILLRGIREVSIRKTEAQKSQKFSAT